MIRFYKPIIVFTLVAVTACGPVITATPPPPTVVPPTATSPLEVPTDLPQTALSATEASLERTDSMKIRLKIEDTELTATLVDSKTTRDFISLLPLTLTLEDYAGTEKISYLPKRLSTEDAPAGSDPSVGDIAYYAPWGNLAIFYRDFGYSSGLIILGKIDGSIDALLVPGSVEATIEMIE